MLAYGIAGAKANKRPKRFDNLFNMSEEQLLKGLVNQFDTTALTCILLNSSHDGLGDDGPKTGNGLTHDIFPPEKKELLEQLQDQVQKIRDLRNKKIAHKCRFAMPYEEFAEVVNKFLGVVETVRNCYRFLANNVPALVVAKRLKGQVRER